MSDRFPIEITGKKRKGDGFWSAPALWMMAEEDGASLSMSIRVTRKTGDHLWALAEQADTQFAEFMAYESEKAAAAQEGGRHEA